MATEELQYCNIASYNRKNNNCQIFHRNMLQNEDYTQIRILNGA